MRREVTFEPGKILVVDDSPTIRLKMLSAVRALGHDAESAEGGADALAIVASTDISLILLDLEMPGTDGYEVLKRLKAAPETRDIPVLVISGVEATADIARAIELGAEDVLPKNFDQVVFQARIEACVERWRLRLSERDYIEGVDRLVAAAHVIERAHFDPSRLGVNDIAERRDDLAGLARQFLGLADAVYVREVMYRRRISLLTGGLLLLLFGAIKGLQPSIARHLGQTSLDAIGIAPWSLATGAAIAILACLAVGQAPKLERGAMLQLPAYAILACAVPQILILSAAHDMPAMIIAGLLAAEAFLVFGIAAVLRHEIPNARRFLGIVIGFAGVIAILASGRDEALSFTPASAFLVLLATIGYAFGKILLGRPGAGDSRRPMADIAVILTMATVASFTYAAAKGALIPIGALRNEIGLTIVALGTVGLLANLLMMVILRLTGPVFGGQGAYTATAGGIVWSVILLGEPLTVWVTAALVMVIGGLLMVMPRDREDDLEAAFRADPELDAARLRLGL